MITIIRNNLYAISIEQMSVVGVSETILLAVLDRHIWNNGSDKFLNALDNKIYIRFTTSDIVKILPCFSVGRIRRTINSLINQKIILCIKPYKNNGNHCRYYTINNNINIGE
jgi:hypothetical protein